ncbi:hypothetical protein BJP40_00050 [Streptomyces sp. CC53]|uniref:DUF397 domain-containing protein n=1 Tax=Streptomyces sp. CC53 TaxID=1906740 RepID=UPI0008DD4F7F|nr:DUF397 domain-containing protein [Streptomyces sp. CC53]OII64298.1 hypothetical protein BJP40_00050 [Streptomyces sp. CC53]
MTTPPTAAQLAGASWRTSTYSGPQNECVEVADFEGGSWVGVRDTKDRTRPGLTVPGPAWSALVNALNTGTL